MARRVMGAVVALMLVATLLLPMASVGAQDAEEIELGPAPVYTTEPDPADEPPAPVEEPPIEEPVIEEPLIENPVVDEPVIEQPAPAETDTSDSQQEPAADTPETAEQANDSPDETDLPADQQEPSVDVAADTASLTMTLDCSLFVTYTGGPSSEWEIDVYETSETPNVWIGTRQLDGPGTNASIRFSVGFDWDTTVSHFYTAVATADGETIGTATTGCDPYEVEEDYDDEDDGDDDDEPMASSISAVSLTCDGTVSFTIEEAAGETLTIRFQALNIPGPNQDRGEISFDATEPGTFQVGGGIFGLDVLVATIISPNAAQPVGEAAVYGCIDGEEQTQEGFVDNVTLSCGGVVTYDHSWIDMVRLELYDGSTNPHRLIDAQGVQGTGSQTVSFEIPAGEYDSLVVRIRLHWELLGIAYANDCTDGEEPEEPDEGVSNFAVTCDGVLSFTVADVLEAGRVYIIDPEQNPGLDLGQAIDSEIFPRFLYAGDHSFSLNVPAGEHDQLVALLNVRFIQEETIAQSSVSGCLDGEEPADGNTPVGENVVVDVDGGAVNFDQVSQPGDTIVTVLDPAAAPPLPAGFDPATAILVDISTSASVSGVTQVCLQMSDDLRPFASDVRMLHFENGQWVDITISSSSLNGIVCGLTEHFSPFALVRRMGDDPGGPVVPNPNPGGPDKPDHHGPKPGWQHPRPHTGNLASSVSAVTNGTAPTGLPNTGSGEANAGNGPQNLLLFLGAIVLIAACGLRSATTRTRGARSR